MHERLSRDTLSYELSLTDPNRFKDQAIESVIRDTMFGKAILRQAMGGDLRPGNVTIDPATFHSDSDARTGAIRLGTAPMPPDLKDQVMFHAERFSYADEIRWRLLHEVNHKFLLDKVDTPEMDSLTDLTFGLRADSRGHYGLSGLGSLGHYRGGYKAREDTVELLTMYADDPGYLAEFTTFLADRTADGIKGQVGLTPLDTASADSLYYMVEAAVVNNI